MAVDTQRSENASDLVGEANLHSVPDVVDDLDRLGLAEIHHSGELMGLGLKRLDASQGHGIADRCDDHARSVIVRNGRALAHEFRMIGQGEAEARLQARGALDGRPDPRGHGAGRQGGTNDDGVECHLRSDGSANIGGHLLDHGSVQASVQSGRRADADDRHVRLRHRRRRVDLAANTAAGDAGADEIVEARLDDRRPAPVQDRQLFSVHVHGDDHMSVTCEARRRHRSYVADAEQTNPHRVTISDCENVQIHLKRIISFIAI